MSSGLVVCILCGRKGTRGFVIRSGGPYRAAGRVSYSCASSAACLRRQVLAEAEARAGWTGVYRCPECGHGHHLTAWGNASVHGPLGQDGEITAYEYDELYEVHEDSIQCSRHPDGGFDKFIGGRWCRWVDCPRCQGRGKFTVRDGLHDYERECPEEGFTDVEGRVAHGGWWPCGQAPPVFALERRGGHRFTPGGSPECRICGALAGSIAGHDACPGKGHQCPVPVAEGDSDTASRIYGREGWFCFQPGVLNDTGTGWRCGRGHVITQTGHIPVGRAHDDVCAWPTTCPWRFLAGSGIVGQAPLLGTLARSAAATAARRCPLRPGTAG